MTTEEAIKYFAGAVDNKTVLTVAADMDKRVQAMVASVYEANELALIALREKAEREDPQPLTIEELLHLHGEPVYVTVPGKPHRNKWCIVNLTGPRPTLFCDEYTGDLFLISGSDAKIYRHKPKEEKK